LNPAPSASCRPFLSDFVQVAFDRADHRRGHGLNAVRDQNGFRISVPFFNARADQQDLRHKNHVPFELLAMTPSLAESVVENRGSREPSPSSR
jgi:hypothetical protein